MDSYFNFSISYNGAISRQCLELGLSNYTEVCDVVKHLPYGRNTDRSEFSKILEEQKGTCATKHAFLKQLAIENSKDLILLYIGIYKMNVLNTKGIGSVLKAAQLDYMPEAHTYLKYKNNILDFTSCNSSNRFYNSLMYEIPIQPFQISTFKVNLHQQFLKSWIEENDIPYDFEEIWTIRENCIMALSQ